MPEILHRFAVRATPAAALKMFTDPTHLSMWWTEQADGQPTVGATYRFGFGPACTWQGRVTAYEPDQCIEWTITEAHVDWAGTRVGVRVSARNDATAVEFYHEGWREANEHYRISNHCWGLYLRILRRFLEHAERIPYDQRDIV